MLNEGKLNEEYVYYKWLYCTTNPEKKECCMYGTDCVEIGL